MAAASISNRFYLPIPKGDIWHTIPLPRAVIEGELCRKDDPDLPLSQRTDEFAQEHLKIINPSDCRVKYVKKDQLVPCSGPARNLSVRTYIGLYHSINPTRELPTIFDRNINGNRKLKENELPPITKPS